MQIRKIVTLSLLCCLVQDVFAQEKQKTLTAPLGGTPLLSKSPLLQHILNNIQLPCISLESNEAPTTSLKDEEGHIIFYDDEEMIGKICSFPSKKCLVIFRGPSKERYTRDAGGSFIVAPSTDPALKDTVEFLAGSTKATLEFSYTCMSRLGNRLLVCSHDKKMITFWNPHIGDKIFDFTIGMTSSIIPSALVNDGLKLVQFDYGGSRILMLSNAGDLICLDMSNKLLLTTMSRVSLAKINCAGTRLFFVQESEAFLWNIDRSQIIKRFEHAGQLSLFSKQGNQLLTSSGSHLYLWDADSGTPLSGEPIDCCGDVHNDIKFIEFSPWGSILVIAYFNKPPKIFDVQKGTVVCTLPDSFIKTEKVTFGNREDQFITISNGKSYAWDIGCPLRLLKAFSHENAFTLPQKVILDLIAKTIQMEVSSSSSKTRLVIDLTQRKDLKQADYEALLERHVLENLCTESDRLELFRILDPFVTKATQDRSELESSAKVGPEESAAIPPLYASPVRFQAGALSETRTTPNLATSPVRFKPAPTKVGPEESATTPPLYASPVRLHVGALSETRTTPNLATSPVRFIPAQTTKTLSPRLPES